MGAMREGWNRMLSFFHKQERESEMEAELASHVEMAVEENMRQGMPEAEARRKALVRFGGIQQARERQRAA
ncbi:MAG TPA: permease prefix domain 1-containing protein, partial [Acidobacteriaceae bacterium]|nr:permease prefix domain 1-containing protein [Acidobacteriaceae bacterium]